MEMVFRVGWAFLALLHLLPALVFFHPSLAQRLYDISPTSDIGVLIVHRGALFAAVVVVAIWAAISEPVRNLAMVVLAISMFGYLYVYWKAGMPPGSLRTIAWADVAGGAVLAGLFAMTLLTPR